NWNPLPPWFLDNPRDLIPRRARSKRRSKYIPKEIIAKEKLDTEAFERYIGHLWPTLPEEKRNSFICLDSIWFNLYMKPAYKTRVVEWIKKKKIFSKKYVVVPILRWSHWCLLIMCDLGGSFQSEAAPYFLLLDSLQKANSRRFEPEIRKFVLDIYKSEGGAGNKKLRSQIKLLVPKCSRAFLVCEWCSRES
ncbi:hypothetical protein Tsubulata_048347, partial [Turnera subulata]